MLDKIMPVILVIVVIAISMAVGAYGYFLITKSPNAGLALITDEQQEKIAIFDLLKTSLVNTITLMGKVEKITGNIITLSAGTNKIDVLIEEDKEISSAVTDKDGKTSYISSVFSDIKVGDSLSIEAEISSNNQINALLVTIF